MTFDDGPGWNYEQVQNTNRILDILQSAGIRATFFVLGGGLSSGGVSQEDWNAAVNRMASEGHTIGIHSWTHSDLTLLSPDEMKDEMQRTIDAIRKAIGRYNPVLWRAPYGSVNETVNEAVQELGLNARQTFWNVDSEDWRIADASELRRKVVDDVNSFWDVNGFPPVVLLHCIHDVTVVALPGIIEDLRNEGFGFQPL